MNAIKILVMGLSIGAFTVTAYGQSQGSNNGFTPPQQEISTESKDSFNKVYPEVESLAKERMKKIKEADPKEAEKINMEYSTKITEKIEDSGLSVNEFNKMAKAKKAQTK